MLVDMRSSLDPRVLPAVGSTLPGSLGKVRVRPPRPSHDATSTCNPATCQAQHERGRQHSGESLLSTQVNSRPATVEADSVLQHEMMHGTIQNLTFRFPDSPSLAQGGEREGRGRKCIKACIKALMHQGLDRWRRETPRLGSPGGDRRRSPRWRGSCESLRGRRSRSRRCTRASILAARHHQLVVQASNHTW